MMSARSDVKTLEAREKGLITLTEKNFIILRSKEVLSVRLRFVQGQGRFL